MKILLETKTWSSITNQNAQISLFSAKIILADYGIFFIVICSLSCSWYQLEIETNIVWQNDDNSAQ